MTLQAAASETLALSEALTIRNVQATKDLLLEKLLSESSLVLDIPKGAECDLSFVQMVESVRMFAQTHGKVVTLLNPAEDGLLSILERGGFLTAMDSSDRLFWFHERQMQ